MVVSLLGDLKTNYMNQRTQLLNELLLESAKGHSNVTSRLISEGATNLSECLPLTSKKTSHAFKDVNWTL